MSFTCWCYDLLWGLKQNYCTLSFHSFSGFRF
uniref:Uncharacterized protein n=1 Tax=Arundo donax TaxID=35708 RepID=A0A0A9GWK7_ARUDO